MSEIPVGQCQCGCGGKTNIEKCSNKSKKAKKGEARQYIYGHNNARKISRLDLWDERIQEDQPCG